MVTYRHPTACLSSLFLPAGTGLAQPKSPVGRCASPEIQEAGIAYFSTQVNSSKDKIWSYAEVSTASTLQLTQTTTIYV